MFFYKIIRILKSIILLLVAFSCRQGDVKILKDNAEVVMLSPESTIDIGMLDVRHIRILDSIIICEINEEETGKCVAVYGLKDRIAKSYYTPGRGPGEVLMLYGNCVDNGSGDLIINDLAQNKLFIGPVHLMHEGLFVETDSRVVSPEPSLRVTSLCSGGGHIYASGFFEDSRIVRLDGTQWSPLADYSPQTKDPELDRFVNQAYQCFLAYNQKHKAIVAACYQSDQIEIINAANGSVRFIKGPENYEPKYKVVADHGGTLAHLPEERMGYVDVKTYGDDIYVLYSGKKHGRNAASGKEIRLINWDGKFIKRYILDREINSFDISDGKFYCSTDEGSILVYSFNN